MKTYRTYRVTNLVNGKMYYGITSKTVAERWDEHCKESATTSRKVLHKAIRKYGRDSFKVETLAEAPKDAACLLERLSIACDETHCRDGQGYNMTAGGEGWSNPHSEESKRKMSVSCKALMTPERRENIRATVTNYFADESNRIKSRKSHATHAKRVIQYDVNGKEIARFASQLEAARETGAHFTGISGCCRGTAKTAGGFKWGFE